MNVPCLLPDRSIAQLAKDEGMIFPFVEKKISHKGFVGDDHKPRKICSFGLSSYGYDVRLGNVFFVARDARFGPDHDETPVLDIHNPAVVAECYRKVHVDDGEKFIIPPHGFVLASTIEKIKMPKDCLAVCMGKSTYARVGLVVNVTPLEPGWEGYVTMELSNTTGFPLAVYAGEGIMQVLFFRSFPCQADYAAGGAKYTGQGPEPVLPRL